MIVGDDIGWFNIRAYHRGMMSGKTPNIDRIAREGMMFTDYYAEGQFAGIFARRFDVGFRRPRRFGAFVGSHIMARDQED